MNQITTTTQPPKTSALAVMAGRLNVDATKLHETLKATVFKGASDQELLALVVVANEYRLNPLTKEIYAFPAKGGGIVPVVSVDGWVSMVNDHPAMDGLEFEYHKDDSGKLEAVTCSIWRKDRSRPIRVTEHLSECRRGTEPWKMENRMLRHKALMQCARYAFGFSGVTDEDEAADTPGLRDVTPAKAAAVVIDPFEEKPRPLRKPKATEDAPADELVVDVVEEEEPSLI
jgi:phage recombination protein Bet